MSLSPRDMDFIEARHAAAREIALALGVPPMLLAIPGDNTYSNYQEATRAFWRQTVLPLANRIAAGLTTWLAQSYNPALSIRPDLDQVEALSGERAELWARLNATAFLTPNEKRAAAGYDPLSDGNAIRSKYDPGQLRNPAGSGRPSGRWTKRPAGLPISSLAQGETGEAPGDEFDPPTEPDPLLQDIIDPSGTFDDEVNAEADPDPENDPNLILTAGGRKGFPIDLEEEEAAGGHTLERHVAKPEAYLKARLTGSRTNIPFIGTSGERRAGSFTSEEAANKLVNSTISQNANKIEAFKEGKFPHLFPFIYIFGEFSSPTGYEAYVATDNQLPRMQTTYAVTVRLRRSSTQEKGYFVHSAWPMNND